MPLTFPTSTTAVKCGINGTLPASTASRLVSAPLNLSQDGFLQMDVLVGDCSGSVSFATSTLLVLRYQPNNSPLDFPGCTPTGGWECFELSRQREMPQGLANRGWQRLTYRIPRSYTKYVPSTLTG